MPADKIWPPAHQTPCLSTKSSELPPKGPQRLAGINRFSGPFWGPFRDLFWDRFFNSFWTAFKQFLGSFGVHFGSQIGLGRAKTVPEELSRAPKQRKAAFPQNLKNPSVFQGFWSPEASQESPRKPQKAPKRHLKSSKSSKK